MKSSKLIEIFKNGNIVIPLYLLKNYKSFKLDLDQFIFLMYLYNLGDRFLFDPTKFCNEMNLELMEVMTLIGDLSDKGFIKVEVVKNEKGIMEDLVILDGFYSKLNLMTVEEVVEEEKVNIEDSTIFEVIEKEFARTLSGMEYEITKAWLENGFSENLIKEAVKEAVFSGVTNLRYIDKILYEWGKNGIKTVEDVEKNRKKRNMIKEKEEPIDLDLIDSDWLDDED